MPNPFETVRAKAISFFQKRTFNQFNSKYITVYINKLKEKRKKIFRGREKKKKNQDCQLYSNAFSFFDVIYGGKIFSNLKTESTVVSEK